ncbi:hypothetical protein LZ30DRAFT_400945 [Colletotrichum cereale]|nr:hypothetical protein LZ30DRAFT_400945 [Colletotrichum cereale]
MGCMHFAGTANQKAEFGRIKLGFPPGTYIDVVYIFPAHRRSRRNQSPSCGGKRASKCGRPCETATFETTIIPASRVEMGEVVPPAGVVTSRSSSRICHHSPHNSLVLCLRAHPQSPKALALREHPVRTAVALRTPEPAELRGQQFGAIAHAALLPLRGGRGESLINSTQTMDRSMAEKTRGCPSYTMGGDASNRPRRSPAAGYCPRRADFGQEAWTSTKAIREQVLSARDALLQSTVRSQGHRTRHGRSIREGVEASPSLRTRLSNPSWHENDWLRGTFALLHGEVPLERLRSSWLRLFIRSNSRTLLYLLLQGGNTRGDITR